MYYFYDDLFLSHDTGRGHPENPGRLLAILENLNKQSWFSKLQLLPRRMATQAELLANHAELHLKRLADACQAAGGALDADTIVGPNSLDAAYLAAGAGLIAADAVLGADGSNKALLLLRPPGHHARREQAMGFCLLNNIAICAHYLKSKGIQRIAILDWDVHHGNGTQESFYEDAQVLYVSLHQSACYPGTGLASEIGDAAGAGYNLNVALDRNANDDDYKRAFTKQVGPRLQEFKPEILLISAGFDAHKKDPLAQMLLSSDFYEWVTIVAEQIVVQSTGGKCISFLEGGYDYAALAESVALHAAALLGLEH